MEIRSFLDPNKKITIKRLDLVGKEEGVFWLGELVYSFSQPPIWLVYFNLLSSAWVAGEKVTPEVRSEVLNLLSVLNQTQKVRFKLVSKAIEGESYERISEENHPQVEMD